MEHSGNKNLLKKIFSPLLDLIFPKKCLGCKKEGDFLCANCMDSIEINPGKSCVVCESEALIQNQLCENCRTNFSFDTVFVISKYEGLIKQLIGALKFDYIEEVSEKLAQLFIKAIDTASLSDKLNGQLIMPIPLHKKRYLERGFNQAELIAKKISELSKMKLDKHSLIRIKNTKQQANLNKEQRLENMKQAFEARLDQVPEKVYLFDDVFTTGQTMSEAAKALKEAGVKEVNVLALAHGN